MCEQVCVYLRALLKRADANCGDMCRSTGCSGIIVTDCRSIDCWLTSTCIDSYSRLCYLFAIAMYM